MHDGESEMHRYLFHYFYPDQSIELLLPEVDGWEYQEKCPEFVERSGRSPLVSNRKQREPFPVYTLQFLGFLNKCIGTESSQITLGLQTLTFIQ